MRASATRVRICSARDRVNSSALQRARAEAVDGSFIFVRIASRTCTAAHQFFTLFS
jgi:hypothetical protein